MRRYLINGVEVDQDEFEAEFDAIVRAYFEENFETFIGEDEGEITFGNMTFFASDIYDMLKEDSQKEIYDEMFEDYVDTQHDDLEVYWVQEYKVGDVNYHFEMEQIEDME